MCPTRSHPSCHWVCYQGAESGRLGLFTERATVFNLWAPAWQFSGTGWLSLSLRWLVLYHRVGQREHATPLLPSPHPGDPQDFGLPCPAVRQLLHYRRGWVVVVVLWTLGSLLLSMLATRLSLSLEGSFPKQAFARIRARFLRVIFHQTLPQC